MDLPRRLHPDPASARHLLLRSADPLPIGPLAQDPQAVRALRQRPQAIVDALGRCLRDHAASGPDARVLPLLLLAARLAVPVPALLPALQRRRERAGSALVVARATRQRAFYEEQVRALDALAQAFATGHAPGRAADAVVFGCRGALPATWAVRDVLVSQGLSDALVSDPALDLDPPSACSSHARLQLATAVAAVAALPDLQIRLRAARNARRRRCILAALAVCLLHDIVPPDAIRPYLPGALAFLPARDRFLLERAAL